MKKRLKNTLVVLSSLVCLQAGQAGVAQEAGSDSSSSDSVGKRALLIGVSDYDFYHKNDGAVPDLHCDQDIEVMKSILENKFKFSPKDITVLTGPEKTRKQAILDAFEKLISETKPGDTVAVHYSGHGSRATDPSNRKPDGFAETIVPSDVDLEAEDDKYHEIADETLAGLVKRLADKNPKLISMTLDCCHSGSLTRAAKRGVIRGFPAPTPKKGKKSGNRSAKRSVENPQPLVLSERKNVIVLSACRPEQVASEWESEKGDKVLGLFTHAFEEAMKAAGDRKDYTYSDLLADITVVMNKDRDPSRHDLQVPQPDGPTSYALMTNVPIIAQTSLVVDKDKNDLCLNAGKVHGMTVNSKFNLYSKDTKDFGNAKPIATAIVKEVKSTNSTLELDAGEKFDKSVTDIDILKAVEKEHQYESPLLVSLRDLKSPFKKEVVDSLKQNQEITLKDSAAYKETGAAKWNVEISCDPNGGIVAVTDDGRKLLALDLAGDAKAKQTQLEQLRRSMRKECIWRHLRDLKNENSNLNVTMTITPGEVKEWDSSGKNPKTVVEKPAASGPLSLKENDAYKIKIKNDSDVEVYVNVFNVQPDGTISALFPNLESGLKNYTPIGPKKEWSVPGWVVVGKPFGIDNIKLVATTKEADFTPLFQEAKARAARAKNHPVANFMLDVNEGSARGGRTTFDADDWAVVSTEMATSEGPK